MSKRTEKIVPILTANDIPGQSPGPAINKMRKALRDYHPSDYIVYALADPAAAFLAGIVFAKENLMHEPINWLRWDRERAIDGERTKGGFYTPTQINYY